jgi:putative transposase
MTTIIRGFKTELDPNDRQRTALLQHAGTARFAYNWGLQRKIEARKNGEKTPGAMELHRELNALKKTEFPWMYESSKCAGQEALRNLDRAYANFFRRCKAKTKGKKGFPRFKSKRNGIGSFRLTGSIHASETHVKLPVIGAVRLKEHGYLPVEARVLSATVSERIGRWFVSLQVEIESQDQHHEKDELHPIVGVDLGIKTLAVVSDGTTFENPNALKSKMRKLRRLQRSLSRKVKGSSNRRKAAKRVAKLHWRIANVRSDTLHKLTTELTRTKSVIVIEDLNVSGMLKNHSLARAISDLGLCELRRQLEYKGEWNDCLIMTADRFFPSSKTCSECGWVNEDLRLSDREWACLDCGCIHDRDHNAAVNLENWGVHSLLAVSSTERLNARGEEGSGRDSGCGETDLDEAGIRHEITVLGGAFFCCPENRFR